MKIDIFLKISTMNVSLRLIQSPVARTAHIYVINQSSSVTWYYISNVPNIQSKSKWTFSSIHNLMSEWQQCHANRKVIKQKNWMLSLRCRYVGCKQLPNELSHRIFLSTDCYDLFATDILIAFLDLNVKILLMKGTVHHWCDCMQFKLPN